MMVTEAEAIKRVQMPAGDESERMVGKARGDREADVARPLSGKRADRVIFDDIKLGPYSERMYDDPFFVYEGVRRVSYPTGFPRVYLGRRPAPWCPKPWSKSSRPSLPPHEGEG